MPTTKGSQEAQAHAAAHVVLSPNGSHVTCHENTRGITLRHARVQQSWAAYSSVSRRLTSQFTSYELGSRATSATAQGYWQSALHRRNTLVRQCLCVAQHLQLPHNSKQVQRHGMRRDGRATDWRYDKEILAGNQEIPCDSQPPTPLPNPIAKQEKFNTHAWRAHHGKANISMLCDF